MEGEEEAKKTKEEVEVEISRAMRARVMDFKEQADSLTLEGVRRALEKDLGMKTFSLDVHKRFIKQCLEEYFYGADDENASKSSGKVRTELAQSVQEEKSGQAEYLQSTVEQKNNSSSPAEETEGSALLGKKSTDHETENSQRDGDLNEDTIKEAIKKRAYYFRSNSEHITLQQVRRLLEEDLKLAKKTLDAYKSFISKELDMVLQSPEIVKSANGVKKKPKKSSLDVDEKKRSKVSKKAHRKSDNSDSNNILSEDDEVDEEIRPRKRTAEKIKASLKSPKRQKKSMEDNKSPSSKEKRPVEADLDKSSEDEVAKSSEDGDSHSSAEEEVKKKQEKPTQVYGKRVEHLKSIIKSCGMGVPPTVYRRAKQAPESKREAFLIKELEEILQKEGLSTNPSEKEIKTVRKRKERAKELEGIDLSNIVSSSRRRTTSNYIPLPKPKIEVESDEDEEDEEDEENEEDSDDDDNEGGDSGEGSDEGVEDESD